MIDPTRFGLFILAAVGVVCGILVHTTTAALGLTFAFFGLCFLVLVGYFAGAIGAWLTRQPKYTNFLRRLTGGVLIGLGVRLALTERR